MGEELRRKQQMLGQTALVVRRGACLAMSCSQALNGVFKGSWGA